MAVLLSTIKDNGMEVNISELLGQEREEILRGSERKKKRMNKKICK